MDYVTAGEAYEKRCEEVVAIWPDDVIDKLKTEAGLVKIWMKEVLFKKAHEQVSIGCDHEGAHEELFNLE